MSEHASSHPDFFRKPWAMMDFLFLRHGSINSDHIAESKSMLCTPFDSVAHSLESHRVHMTHQFIFLDRARHSVNNGDKVDLYEASMAAHSHMLASLRLYKNATLFADRTFESMAPYVELHAPDQVQHSADLGYAKYSAAATVAPRSKHNPLRNPSGHSPSGTRHYCYVHGYATHKCHCVSRLYNIHTGTSAGVVLYCTYMHPYVHRMCMYVCV